MWYTKVECWNAIECDNLEQAMKLYIIFKKNNQRVTLIHKAK